MLNQDVFEELVNASASGFLKGLHKQIFIAKDMPLTNRVINHWHDRDLLLYKKPAGLWRKFSVADYIWVLLLNKLRRWNIGLETIKKVRDQCVSSSFPFLEQTLVRQMMNMEPGEVPKEMQDVVLLFNDREALKETLAQPEMQMFSVWLNYCIQQNVDVLLRILPDEENTLDFVILNEDTKSGQLLLSIAERGGVCISLQALLNEFYESSQFKWEDSVPLELSDQEKKIIGIIREKKICKVMVRVLDGSPKKLEVTDPPINMSTVEFQNTVMNKRYVKYEVVKNEGDVLHVELTQRIKL